MKAHLSEVCISEPSPSSCRSLGFEFLSRLRGINTQLKHENQAHRPFRRRALFSHSGAVFGSIHQANAIPAPTPAKAVIPPDVRDYPYGEVIPDMVSNNPIFNYSPNRTLLP